LKKIAVISHDAGGAEILSNWLKKKKYLYSTVLRGPAKKVFKKNNIEINDNELIVAIKNSEYIITGTSWQSNLEKEAIFFANKLGKYTITFLDHWVNYEERFIYKGKLTLPNEIWVTDKFAFKLAKNTFRETIVKMKHNDYLINLKKIIKEKSLLHKKNFANQGLFIGENISEHALLTTGDINGFGYTEKEALKFLLDNINNLKININNLKIRPHPSEKKAKYNWARDTKLVKDISNEKDLIDDILESDIIFGCESNAMIVGVFARKKVISCIPNFKKKCSLPYPQIIYLRNLLLK
tara:strand:+ start:2146 stop:3033 length:888 start_codon:yes stop_codon:yes gene_type:complete